VQEAILKATAIGIMKETRKMKAGSCGPVFIGYWKLIKAVNTFVIVTGVYYHEALRFNSAPKYLTYSSLR
jgi:hypothetical protein